jgi:DNA polymerase-3 subunit epsilon
VLSTQLLAYYRQISQQLLTIVDVETSGYTPAEARVIEVSVLQASLTDGIQHQQTTLINPPVKVPTKITRFTGISQAMVDQAPLAAAVWPQYLPLLNKGILTAHNLAFDYGFLQAEFQRLGMLFARPGDEQLCSVILARQMLPDLRSRSLPDLVRHFGFDVGRSHRAEADTLACWLLTQRLLTEILQEEDEKLLPRFARQWLPLTEAAAVLGCSSQQARQRLASAGVPARVVGRQQTPMYQRGAVEQVFWQTTGGNQLSCL